MPDVAARAQTLDIATKTYIAVPPEKVWTCLTTAEGWRSWFVAECELDLRVGGRIRLVWKNWGVDHIDHPDGGAIKEVVPQKRFSFEWHEDEALAGGKPTTVTFELVPHSGGTIVKLTDTGYPASELSKFCGYADCCLGWGEAMTLLKFYLEHGVRYTAVPK